MKTSILFGIAIVFALLFSAPTRAISGTFAQLHWEGSSLEKTWQPDWFTLEKETYHQDASSEFSSPARRGLGYWFEDAPWLGLASRASILQAESENLHFYPRDERISPGFFLLRYPKGHLQPHLGIGPTLFVTGLDIEDLEPVQHIFLGFSLNF